MYLFLKTLNTEKAVAPKEFFVTTYRICFARSNAS